MSLADYALVDNISIFCTITGWNYCLVQLNSGDWY